MITIKMRRFLLAVLAVPLLAGCQGTSALDSVAVSQPLPPPPDRPVSVVEADPALQVPAASAARVENTSAGADLDHQGFPNFNVVPQGATNQMTSAEEAQLLETLIAALDAQPVLTPAEQALHRARIQRLAQIRARHAIETERVIEAR